MMRYLLMLLISTQLGAALYLPSELPLKQFDFVVTDSLFDGGDSIAYPDTVYYSDTISLNRFTISELVLLPDIDLDDAEGSWTMCIEWHYRGDLGIEYVDTTWYQWSDYVSGIDTIDWCGLTGSNHPFYIYPLPLADYFSVQITADTTASNFKLYYRGVGKW